MKNEAKITLEVVFRNHFESVTVPENITLVSDLGSDCSIYTMDKPRVLRGRRILIEGVKDNLKKAMDFWTESYGDIIYTDNYKLR